MIQFLIILLSLSSFAYAQDKQNVQDIASSAEKKKQTEERRKQGEKAIEEARQQVAADPNSAEAHLNLAETLLKGPHTIDDYEKMREAYLRAVQLKPDYAKAYYRLGSFYAWQDEFKDAYAAFQKAISIKPDYVEAYCALGFSYLKKKFGDGRRLPITEEESRAAAEAFKKAVQIKPDMFEAYNGLGEANCYLGNYTEALEALNQATTLNPNDIMAHTMMGAVYIQLKNRDAALEQYEALKRIAAQIQKVKEEQKLDEYPNFAEDYAERLLKQIQEKFKENR